MSDMNGNNSNCAICGKPYHLCLSCKDKMQAEPWKKHTDTSEHFKIYQIIRGYNTGIYTKAEASEKLKTVDKIFKWRRKHRKSSNRCERTF